jgi:uncharacterized protein involved in exopolysaccharide biosynthesis
MPTVDSRTDYSLRPLFDLLSRRRRFIATATLVSIAMGFAAYFILPAKYKAETVFILKNPLFADRSNLYGDDDKAGVYFAGEDEISRLISMSESDSFHNKLIRSMKLDEAYKLNIDEAEEYQKLRKLISKRLKVYRSENNNVVLLYYDKNARRAADVANYCVPELDASLRKFYNSVRRDRVYAISEKIAEQDSSINALTDTLIRLREQYGIFDIVNPARHNIMSGSMSDNGRPGFARGLEVIQNIGSVKDELVASRAANITLLGRFTTGDRLNNQPLTNILKRAATPQEPVLSLPMVLVVCAVAGFFASLLYVLAAGAFYSKTTGR